MKISALMIILISLFWGVGSSYWYVCEIKCLCAEEGQGQITVTAATAPDTQEELNEAGNLLFTKGISTPETNESTRTTLDSLRQIPLDGLLIKGYYRTGEEEEVALARASKVRELVLKSGFNKPITLLSGFDAQEATGKFKAIEFEALQEVIQKVDADFSIEKSNEKIVIYFPHASADPHSSAEIVQELKKTAKLANDNNWQIRIVGHTDNSGTHEINQRFGQLRADAIKQLLLELGANAKKVTALSKGETEPIASNNTAQGKEKNRRVEITTSNQ